MTGRFGNGAKWRRLTYGVGLALLCTLVPGTRLLAQNRLERSTAYFQDTMYVVKVGDVLRLRVWGYPDPDKVLEGSFPVEQNGQVLLPVVGAVSVAGNKAKDVQEIIRKRYSAEQQNPVVTVWPFYAVSIMGEVGSPGVIDVSPSYTLFDAISMTGGFREFANRKDIIIVRNGKAIHITGSDLDEASRNMAQTPLESGDRVLVGRTKAGSLQVVTALVSTLVSIATLITVLTR